jgi:uncharacterized membrane protein
MPALFAITYSDPDSAKQALESVDWSDFDRLINVEAACWIGKDNGEVSVHPRGHPGAGKAVAGGALGLLAGALFAIPVVGLAAGAAIGIHKGRHADLGIDDAFVESIGAQLASGGSAIIVLFEDGADTGKAAIDLARFGGSVHSSDLAPERLARFQAELDRANAAAPPSDRTAESE